MKGKKTIVKTYKNKISLAKIAIIITTVIIFVSSVYCIFDLGQILFISDEKRILGQVYSMLGVDWSSFLEENSLYSIGYSILLLPIYSILKNPTAAYKISILINAFSISLIYLLSVMVFKKIFVKKNIFVLIFGCTLATLAPGFAFVKLLVVPDIVLLLVFIIQIAVLIFLYEKPNNIKLFGFGLLLCLGVLFRAEMLCVLLAGIIVMYILMSKNKISRRNLFLTIIMISCIIILGYISETIILSKMNNSNILTPSLENFIQGICLGWSNLGIWGLIDNIIVKLYSIGIGNVLFVFIGMYFIISKVVENIRKKFFVLSEYTLTFTFIFISFLLVLICSSLYYDNNRIMGSQVDVRVLQIVCYPITILGIVDLLENIKNSKYYKKLLLITSVIILISFSVYNIFMVYNFEDMGEYNIGVLSLYNNGINEIPNVFYVSLSIILFFIIFIFIGIIFKSNKLFNIIGFIFCVSLFLGLNFDLVNKNIIEVNNETSLKCGEIPSLILNNESDDPIYYISNDKIDDFDSFQLQFLLGENQMKMIDLRSRDKNELTNDDSSYSLEDLYDSKEMYIITSSDSYDLDFYARKYKLLELTSNYALFTIKNSNVDKKVSSDQMNRIYNIPLNKNGEVYLPPGTYECTVTVNTNNSTDLGKLKVMSGNKILYNSSLDLGEKISDDKLNLYITFTSYDIIKNLKFNLIENSQSQIELSKIIYRKISSEKTFGLENINLFNGITDTIIKIDNNANTKGTIGIVDLESNTDETLSYVRNKLIDYSIEKINDVKNCDTDYLIFKESDKSFYNFMENYVIIKQNSSYILMVQNTSEKIRDCKSLNIEPLSDGYNLKLDNYFSIDKKTGQYNFDEPIKLSSGNYEYIFEVEIDNVPQIEESIGKIIIEESGESIAEKKIYSNDFINNKALIKVPIISSTKLISLTYSVKLDLNNYSIHPVYIKMINDKYKVGSESSDDLTKLSNIISNDDNYKLVYLTSKSNKLNGIFSLDYLNQLFSAKQLEAMTLHELNKLKSDCYVITKKFNGNIFNLAERFTLIGLEGDYSLWVKNDGEYLNNYISNGGAVLTVDRKVPASLLANKTDMDIKSLDNIKSGKYKLYIKINKDYKDEIFDGFLELTGRLTEKEIEKSIDQEINNKIESGELKEEALISQDVRDKVLKNISTYISCADKDITNDMFDSEDSTIITINLNVTKNLEKLDLNILNYKSNNIHAEILWIEKMD